MLVSEEAAEVPHEGPELSLGRQGHSVSRVVPQPVDMSRCMCKYVYCVDMNVEFVDISR